MYRMPQVPPLMWWDEELEVTREGTRVGAQISYQGGLPVKINPTVFCVRCTVQPLNGRDLVLVPEGDRYNEQLWLWMANGEQTAIQTNDLVSRKGVTYQVQSAENWGSYTRARMMRVDVGPQATTP